MVVIRLTRGGSKKRPFYHIVVTDKRNPRDGRYIESIGYFNPIAEGKEIPFKIDAEKLTAWTSKGAQLSDRVASLVKSYHKVVEAA
jgi:small subunit ribosomal protein S16